MNAGALLWGYSHKYVDESWVLRALHGSGVQGNVVRLATRPVVIGRVVHFRVGQVAHAEGCYSNGLVQVAPLPEEVFGKVRLSFIFSVSAQLLSFNVINFFFLNAVSRRRMSYRFRVQLLFVRRRPPSRISSVASTRY
jgi:hypothetical protein